MYLTGGRKPQVEFGSIDTGLDALCHSRSYTDFLAAKIASSNLVWRHMYQPRRTVVFLELYLLLRDQRSIAVSSQPFTRARTLTSYQDSSNDYLEAEQCMLCAVREGNSMIGIKLVIGAR